jgi:penicillin-insensitive murein endopeptidase
MIRFDAEGMPVQPQNEESYDDPKWAERRFDTARNWLMLEAFLTDPSIRVQWVFVATALEDRMLAYARRKHRSTWITEYAATVMQQPGDSAPHDDHFHIRVYCSRTDRFHGCEDRGPVWQHEKKSFKYFGPERYDPVTWRLLLGSHTALL